MSPLIDVTNTVAPDIPKGIQLPLNKSSPTNKSEPKNIKDMNSLPSDEDSLCHESKTTKDASVVTKCNKPKASHHMRKKLTSRLPSISSDESSGLQKIPKQELSHRIRVPPLPSVDFSQAFAALDLGKEKLEGFILANKMAWNLAKEKNNLESGCRYRLTGSSNSIGPPASSFSSTYQCVSCSLEFSSLENLTCHLVKHIYEGLHAASWLSNAMSVLVPPSVSEPTTCAISSDTNESQTKHTFSEFLAETKLNTNNSNSVECSLNT